MKSCEFLILWPKSLAFLEFSKNPRAGFFLNLELKTIIKFTLIYYDG